MAVLQSRSYIGIVMKAMQEITSFVLRVSETFGLLGFRNSFPRNPRFLFFITINIVDWKFTSFVKLWKFPLFNRDGALFLRKGTFGPSVQSLRPKESPLSLVVDALVRPIYIYIYIDHSCFHYIFTDEQLKKSQQWKITTKISQRWWLFNPQFMFFLQNCSLSGLKSWDQCFFMVSLVFATFSYCLLCCCSGYVASLKVRTLIGACRETVGLCITRLLFSLVCFSACWISSSAYMTTFGSSLMCGTMVIGLLFWI